jgi:hypothetical protein
VARYPYPPYDFECLYKHTCPYLDGLSTQWVLEEYRRAHDVYQEHLRIIDLFDGQLKIRDERVRVLERENAELKAKLQALHRRQFKAIGRKAPRREKTMSTAIHCFLRALRKNVGHRWGIRDGCGPSQTILTGLLMCPLRRSAPIANSRV